jgi:chromosome segregation ATPase
MQSVEELEQSLTELSGKIATTETTHAEQGDRRKKIGDELGTIASKRAELSVRLARGDAKAAAQIDALDQKEKNLERERQGVDQIISELKAEIVNLEAEKAQVGSQCTAIRTAERLQMLTEKLQTQEKEFLATLNRARVATAEMSVTMDELDMMNIQGKRVAQVTAERIYETAHPAYLENSGWKRPRVLTGLGWRFFVTALLPPDHPSHPGR